jgi:5-hydroxyisourate hydrolase-like protein (transthyretin family)
VRRLAVADLHGSDTICWGCTSQPHLLLPLNSESLLSISLLSTHTRTHTTKEQEQGFVTGRYSLVYHTGYISFAQPSRPPFLIHQCNIYIQVTTTATHYTNTRSVSWPLNHSTRTGLGPPTCTH